MEDAVLGGEPHERAAWRGMRRVASTGACQCGSGLSSTQRRMGKAGFGGGTATGITPTPKWPNTPHRTTPRPSPPPRAHTHDPLQICRWRFLAFSGTFKVQLGVVEDDAARTLLFNLVHSNFMSDFEGRWAVAPAAAPPGAPPGEQWCEVQHTLAVVPAVQVPAPVAGYTRFIFVKQVEGILLDLQRGLPRWRAERS